MDPINPYAPPTAPVRPSASLALTPEERRRARLGRFAWVGLFGLNLILPTLLASTVLTPTGWLGLLAALVVLGGGGFALLAARPRWTGTAVAGAALMAPTQLLPVLQFAAGMIGLGLVGWDEDPEAGHNADLDLIRGFVATLVTGSILLGLGMVGGLLMRATKLVGRRGGGQVVGDFGVGRLHEPIPDV